MYAVAPEHVTPLLAQSAIAFCSAWTVACSWLFLTIDVWEHPGKNPLYPCEIILLSFTIKQPTCNLLQGERVAVTFTISLKYSSQEGRVFIFLFSSFLVLSYICLLYKGNYYSCKSLSIGKVEIFTPYVYLKFVIKLLIFSI